MHCYRACRSSILTRYARRALACSPTSRTCWCGSKTILSHHHQTTTDEAVSKQWIPEAIDWRIRYRSQVASMSSCPAMRFITIRSSEKRPDEATVRIRLRDWCFYINATDMQRQRVFQFLQTLIGMRLADPGAAKQAPAGRQI